MYPDFRHIDMPTAFCKDDEAWIREQLLQLPPSLRRRVAVKYTAVYQETFDSEPVSFRRENRARREANTRLRLFVKNQGRALQGYTVPPPLAGTPRS
ncbi:hypothetical protein ACLMPP_12495 [Yersinia enterocolitica]|uniref:hypothetical protein n=1 Tax=Yersinia enterocolitica TaxID=630 RepID=UPI00398CECE4